MRPVHALAGVACLALAAVAYAQSTAVAAPDNAPVQAAPLQEKPATWGDAQVGQSKAGACAACHGSLGRGGVSPGRPAIEMPGDDAVAACNALGLFGGGSRLVLVDNVEVWKAPDAKAISGAMPSRPLS